MKIVIALTLCLLSVVVANQTVQTTPVPDTTASLATMAAMPRSQETNNTDKTLGWGGVLIITLGLGTMVLVITNKHG